MKLPDKFARTAAHRAPLAPDPATQACAVNAVAAASDAKAKSAAPTAALGAAIAKSAVDNANAANAAPPSGSRHIVVHYHELWLKKGNRRFFLHKLRYAIRRALEGLEIVRMSQPSDRLLIELRDASQLNAAMARLGKVFGIAYLGIARVAQPAPHSDSNADSAAPADPLQPIFEAAWDEIRTENFQTFAVRAKRSDKRFPIRVLALEREVGGRLFDKLAAEGRPVRVDLEHPELTCHIEIARGAALLYARRIPGPGGLPMDTAGKLVCLLSGGFDSAVAAYKMMKRGAHPIYVHFWGGGGEPGESSVHVARGLVARLTPWQFAAKLYLVPFEPLQREIAASAPEEFRTLLYRRLMLRIAERIALRDNAKGLITGDSLAQVSSQTLQNMQAVGSIARLPLYRPLVGDDKLEIQDLARRIGTHDISAEHFHDCCAVFQSKSPVLFATPEALDVAEHAVGVDELVKRGLRTLTIEKFRYARGQVTREECRRKARVGVNAPFSNEEPTA